MKTYRVGDGRSPSGKILDRDTEWYLNYDTALSRAKELKKRLYVSDNHGKYTLLWSYENNTTWTHLHGDC